MPEFVRADPALSDERIDAAPECYKALFREYDIQLVMLALAAVGMDRDYADLTEQQQVEGCAEAEKILVAERRARQRDLLNGAG